MQIPHYKSTRRFGFNMTPMIDVVFLLIIFFLVSSHLSRNESLTELDLPIAPSASDDRDQATPRVTVNVSGDGSLTLAGRPIDAAQLKSRFVEAIEKEGQDIEVRIRGSRVASYASVEPIMRSCTQAGIWNVTWAVYRKEQP